MGNTKTNVVVLAIALLTDEPGSIKFALSGGKPFYEWPLNNDNSEKVASNLLLSATSFKSTLQPEGWVKINKIGFVEDDLSLYLIYKCVLHESIFSYIGKTLLDFQNIQAILEKHSTLAQSTQEILKAVLSSHY